MLSELFKTLSAWLIILPAAYGIGSRFQLLIVSKNPVLKGIFYYALGFAILSYSVVLLSFFGLLKPLFVWILLIVSCAINFKSLSSWSGWIKKVVSELWPDSKAGKLFAIIFFISTLSLLTGVLSPELGGDALCYQLNLPKLFLNKASVSPIFLDINSYFPMFMNYLYLIGLATGGMFAAKFFHFFTGFLLFLALKVFIQEETQNKNLAYFLALCFWLSPVIFNMLSTTYVDVGLALYSFLGFILFYEAIQNNNLRSFFVSGLFLGCSISIKYLGIISVFIISVYLLFYLLKNKFRVSIFKASLLWASGILTTSIYCFVRNGLLTKNPFYPYLSKIFHTEAIPGLKYDQLGFGWDTWRFITVFFNLFQHPTAFGGFSDRIGIFYFLAIPFAIVGVVLVKRARFFGFFCLFFLGLWFFICQASRYLVPALPMILITAGFGINVSFQKMSNLTKFFLILISTTVLCVYFAAGLFHYRYSYLLYTGKWNWNDYLVHMERTGPIALWTNSNLKPDATILLESEPRLFYFNRNLIRDAALKFRTKYNRTGMSEQQLSTFLKSCEITHILLNTELPKENPNHNSIILRNFVKSSYVKPIKSITSENVRDAKFKYDLYELKQEF